MTTHIWIKPQLETVTRKLRKSANKDCSNSLLISSWWYDLVVSGLNRQVLLLTSFGSEWRPEEVFLQVVVILVTGSRLARSAGAATTACWWSGSWSHRAAWTVSWWIWRWCIHTVNGITIGHWLYSWVNQQQHIFTNDSKSDTLLQNHTMHHDNYQCTNV